MKIVKKIPENFHFFKCVRSSNVKKTLTLKSLKLSNLPLLHTSEDILELLRDLEMLGHFLESQNQEMPYIL
jgi:hypothetical protein